jgi:hypothetical protein
MRKSLCLLAMIVSPVAAIPVAAAEQEAIRPDAIPRSFQGEFRWTGGRTRFSVMLAIDNIQQDANGVIVFTGTDRYVPGGCLIRTNGRIDPNSRHVSITETRPSCSKAIVDGSFEGTISADLSSIAGTWTTRSTGAKGDLRVRATGVREQPSAPPPPPPHY